MANPFDKLPQEKKIEQAKKGVAERALDQREIYIGDIEQRFFLDLNPHTRAFRKVYGFKSGPVVPASIVMTNNNFECPFPSAGDENSTPLLATRPKGSPGMASITTLAGVPATGQRYFFHTTPVDEEIELARFPLGVGTDLAFLKPKNPFGDAIFATRISGYLLGSSIEAASSDGFLDNGMIRLKVVDAEDKVAYVILECSTKKFNAGATKRYLDTGVVSTNIDTDFALYPNMIDEELITEGSSLVLTITGYNEKDIYNTLGVDGAGNPILIPKPINAVTHPVNGKKSRIYIETTRLIYLEQWDEI